MSSHSKKVKRGICDAEVHKNSIQKHQKQHNLTSAEDRATLSLWDRIMSEGLVAAKGKSSQLSNVAEEHVTKIRRELTKVGKYSHSATTSSANLTEIQRQMNPNLKFPSSPRKREPHVGETDLWASRIEPFTDRYLDYCTSEMGPYLAESNIRNHAMILRKKARANPEATDVTEMFTPATIDAMLTGKNEGVIQNSTRYDYLLILKVSNF